MSEFRETAEKLRNDPEVVYNCCCAAVLPFADKAGIDKETVMKMTKNFGGGMRNADRCGAICGGLMVLGMFDVGDPKTIAEYYRSFRENHDGMLDCRDLLKANAAKGLPKKPHCDGMVYESVELAERLLKERGKI
ncbi:MAG: C_GCAxxG_C_C family protein [Solobacterium sp.]|nr:C_GCAxxG_C_C family protein [Erysipelotrichaceae bacterium]MBQ9152271.1 C_GCAxxG_C_C family protein [Solobacterium sp.]